MRKGPPRLDLAFTWRRGFEPVVVFIHGLGADASCFRYALDSPFLNGHALLLPDLRGFGRSPMPESFSGTMADQGELLARFLRLSCAKHYLHDSDSPISPGLAETLRLSGVPATCIPESGHGLMEDNPEAFYRAIGDFLRQVNT